MYITQSHQRNSILWCHTTWPQPC